MTQRPLPWVVGAIIVLMLTIYYYQWMPALLLVIYALYGLIRPFIPKILRKEIEDEILSPEEDDSDLEGESGVDNK